MKKVVIVGGGSAGLLAAAYFTKRWVNVSVNLYYDTNNPNIGVGEGTTFGLIEFFEEVLGISAQEVLRDMDCSIKLGVCFKNWIKGREYYHGFAIKREHDLQENIASIYGLLSDSYNGGFHFSKPSTTVPNLPFHEYEQAFHINSQSLSEYLLKYLRGKVNIVDDIVENVNVENNYIKSIECKNSGIVTSDLFIDASGFNTVLFKHLNTKWIDNSNYLPVDRAIPQQINNIEKIDSYTLSEATDNGWIWQIPLLNRYGTGYLYSSQFTSDDEAREDYNRWLIDNHGVELDNNIIIKYRPGYYEESWVGNCVAMGLSSGFTEPLEALHIHQTLYQLNILNAWNSALENLEYDRQLFNKRWKNGKMDIDNFIALHYCTNRTDSLFWRHVTNNRPDWIKNFIEKLDKDYLDIHQQDEILNSFPTDSWIQIAYGLNLLNKESIINFMSSKYNAKIILHDSKEQYNSIEKMKQYDWVDLREVIETVKELSHNYN